jgi:large subunit ribosomal protein L22
MKAALNTYRQSPRKVRLVADLVRGKDVKSAFVALQFANKKAAEEITKLLKSAVANAKGQDKDENDLIIKEIQVNKGATLKRIMPRARGSASRINKRTSHIHIVLGERPKDKKEKSRKKVLTPNT